MKKAKSALIVQTDLKSKSLDFAGRRIKSVDVYEFAAADMLREAEDLKEHYDNVVIVVKTNK